MKTIAIGIPERDYFQGPDTGGNGYAPGLLKFSIATPLWRKDWQISYIFLFGITTDPFE